MYRRNTLLALLAAVCLLATARAYAPQPAAPPRSTDILPFAVTETTLANGLKLIIVPTGFPNLVAIQIPVQTGSRNEVEPGKTGFAHFFEHLMFRGTKAFPPSRAREIMTRAGARDNAGTGDDFTRYYATFAKEDLEPMLELYADMFQNLSYPEPDFKTEARAILGEYNKNSANPLAKLFEVQRDHAFTTHTYKHTTMGFIKDIEDMPSQYEYSKVFFERWYRPDYTTVIVAGDVEPATALPLIEKYWGGWKGGAAAVQIPAEPAPKAPQYVHIPWSTPTLPWVTVAFRAPAFSETAKDYAAMDMVATLYFGETSDLYKRLVVQEQKVDTLFADNPGNVDPSLFTVGARVKKAEDAAYVRDEILRTIGWATAAAVPARVLADAKSNARYSFTRTLDSTERIAAVVSTYAPYRRSFQTINNLYRVYDSLTPDDLLATARRSFTDAGLIVTTLSHDTLPEAIKTLPARLTATGAQPFAQAAGGTPVVPAAEPVHGPGPSSGEASALPVIVQKSPLPQLNIKLQFLAGSADDPAGKEGLAALAAAMIANAGSKAMTIDEITKALYPMAGSFSALVDKEMTTFTANIHRDNWQQFFDVVLPQLLDPGYRSEDFTRVKTNQLNALVEDLRSNNEEELGKERLQANIFHGTPYGHVALGTVAGINSATLDEVKSFVQKAYTRGNLVLGANGDAPDELVTLLRHVATKLPAGRPAEAKGAITGSRPSGMDVEIIEKDTRATAISFGLPIAVTRKHPDYPALSVARAWLGEHRSSNAHLFQRLRDVRGLNYGDYAYIEAFPRGMFQFFPDPNIVRRAQIFEIWIRPVVPENGHLSLRIAIHELDQLITNGLSRRDFDETRDYLMKNVYVMTARQDHQLGYALDSRWYAIGEFTSYMRERLAKLTVEEVNAAIRKHLSATDLSVVIITKDAQGLKEKLVSDAFSPIAYDGEKPKELLDEDRIIGARRLNLAPDKVRITPVVEVFSR